MLPVAVYQWLPFNGDWLLKLARLVGCLRPNWDQPSSGLLDSSLGLVLIAKNPSYSPLVWLLVWQKTRTGQPVSASLVANDYYQTPISRGCGSITRVKPEEVAFWR